MENTSKKHHHGGGHSSITMNGWLKILFLLTIPLVNIFFLIKWAFFQQISRTKRNFSRAVITWGVILIMLIVLSLIIFHIDIVETLAKFRDSISSIPVDAEQISPSPDESYLYQ